MHSSSCKVQGLLERTRLMKRRMNKSSNQNRIRVKCAASPSSSSPKLPLRLKRPPYEKRSYKWLADLINSTCKIVLVIFSKGRNRRWPIDEDAEDLRLKNGAVRRWTWFSRTARVVHFLDIRFLSWPAKVRAVERGFFIIFIKTSLVVLVMATKRCLFIRQI